VVSMEKVSQDAPGGCMTNSPGVIKIVSAVCKPIRLDFRMSVAHSLASRHFTENIIVEVKSDSGLTGFGECVPRKYVTGETSGSVVEVLSDILPLLEGKSFHSTDEVVAFLQDFGMSAVGTHNPAALCAMELALFDLAGKTWDIPVPDIIGLEKSEEPLIYSLVVPLLDDDSHDSFLMWAKKFGFKHAKIKVDAHNPSARVSRVKKILGDDIEIRVDVNCAWNRTNAPGFLKELANLGVVSVEQPLPADDLEGCANLRNNGLILITLDESVSSVSDVNRSVSLDACDIINVRVSKCGGLLGAKSVIEAALQKGLKVQLGAQVGESCILTAAGAHLAAGTPSFMWLEGCFGKYLLKKGLCDNEPQFAECGRFFPPKGPGLGININKSLVEEAEARYKKNLHHSSRSEI